MYDDGERFRDERRDAVPEELCVCRFGGDVVAE